jgi:O-antigen/teichoic acid export membrane protein
VSEQGVGPGGVTRLTPFVRNNYPFLVVLALLIFLPGVITYFGPSFVGGVGEFQWLGIAWGIALFLAIIADENFVPGERNLSSGFRRPGHISHSLVSNPMFIAGLLLLVLGPPPITFYGPLVFLDSPDWAWLLLGWVVAAAAAFLAYRAIKSEEDRLAA